MKTVALIIINSAILPNWGFDYNPGDFNVPLKPNYIHTPIVASASLLE